MQTKLGTPNLEVTQGMHAQPFEVFHSVGKAGTVNFGTTEVLGGLISLTLRSDSSVALINSAGDIAA